MNSHPRPAQLRGRLVSLAATVLALAAAPSLAAEAGSSFTVGVQLLSSGTGTCAASAGAVTCRPTVVAAAAGSERPGGPVLGYRLPDAAPLKVAGELVEVNEENHYAWAESNYFALGEYSSRLVVSGSVRYVEMTVSW